MFPGVTQSDIECDATRNAEQLKSWEHQVEKHEKLTGSKLFGDVKVSVVIREAPSKLRKNFLVKFH